MNCPACTVDNDKDAKTCVACGAELRPSRVARNGKNRFRAGPAAPLSPLTEANHRAALRAYRVCVAGLAPGLGLVLGPAAVVLGALASRGCRRDPDFSLHGPLRASILLGVGITCCNWLGFTLMALGLRSAGVL